MSPLTNQEVQLTSRPEGLPAEKNFTIAESAVPQIQEGEILVENLWLSVDPYMRGRMREGKSYASPFELGKPIEGLCIGRVIESKARSLKQGDFVRAQQGWKNYWSSKAEDVEKVDSEQAPLTSYLDVLGMTGMTAYVGLLHIGQAKEGDRVFVSAASGAVGSVVCQIAKLKKCWVIGSTGTAEKMDWLRSVAGVDEAFNYQESANVSEALGDLCPQGIDLYFDNVGGEQLEAAIEHMNNFGRIVCCGMISQYNQTAAEPGPRNMMQIIGKRLRLQGFIVSDHQALQEEFQRDMSRWIKEGKIHREETVTKGLKNAPQAFIDLFSGRKLGKSLVQVAD